MAIAVRPTATISPQQISKDAPGLPQNHPACARLPSQTLRRRRAAADGRAPRPNLPEAFAFPPPGTCLNLCDISMSVARAQPWHGRSAIESIPMGWAGGRIGFGFRQNGKANARDLFAFLAPLLLLAPRDRARANSEEKGAECEFGRLNAAKSCKANLFHPPHLLAVPHFPFAQPVGQAARPAIPSKFTFVPQLSLAA